MSLVEDACPHAHPSHDEYKVSCESELCKDDIDPALQFTQAEPLGATFTRLAVASPQLVHNHRKKSGFREGRLGNSLTRIAPDVFLEVHFFPVAVPNSRTRTTEIQQVASWRHSRR